MDNDNLKKHILMQNQVKQKTRNQFLRTIKNKMKQQKFFSVKLEFEKGKHNVPSDSVTQQTFSQVGCMIYCRTEEPVLIRRHGFISKIRFSSTLLQMLLDSFMSHGPVLYYRSLVPQKYNSLEKKVSTNYVPVHKCFFYVKTQRQTLIHSHL